MIVCSLPFTALAKTVEPLYESMNDKEILNPATEDMWYVGDSITLGDVIANGLYDHVNTYNPTVAIIVSSNGNSEMGDFTAATNARNTEYMGSSKVKYDDATILNPAELKAGQRIAITIEVGGMDLIRAAQFQGTYDPELIIPGGYASNTAYKTENSSAGKLTAANVNSRTCLSNVTTFMGTSYEESNSVTLDTRNCTWAAANMIGDTDSQYMGEITDEIGSTYGLCLGTISFEVQKDCDLKDAIKFKTHTGYCFIDTFDEADYDNMGYGAQIGKFPKYMNPGTDGGELYDRYFTWLYDNYSGGSEPTTVDYKYIKADGTSETVTVNAGETPTAPANTAAKVEHIADTQTHKTTTYTWPTFDANVTEYTEVPTTSDPVKCTYDVEHTKLPSYTEAGIDTYTCSVCGDSFTKEVPMLTCDHTWGDWEVTKAATCKEKGIETRTCSTCGETETREIALADHTWDEGVETTAPTCTTEGVKTFTCSVCGETKTEAIPVVDHQWDEGVVTTPATCVAEGVKTFTCAVGGETKTEAIPVDADNHAGPTEVQNAKEATCTEEGYTGDTVCTACGITVTPGEKIEKAAHTAGEPVKENVVESTYETGGSYDLVTRCTVCNEVIATEHVTTPVLEGGIAITVKASALGTATIAGKDVTTSDVTATVAPNSDVVLTATPAEGATFVGWNANGKMVSTEATITVKALNVVTYEPVFETSAADKFTVVFTDKYGNVISTQTVAAGTEIAEPVAPAIAGHTFAGWSMTAEEIDALTAAATITAVYEKDAEAMYTVTATDGATVNGETTVQVPYDTAVTVTATDAKAWKIGDAIVAYGDTYTFYVGADVTVTPVFALETAQAPTVTAVSTSEVTAANGLKAGSFLATRSMTDDCTYVNAGYIYGLNVADSNIELSDVDGKAVKVKYCATAAEQFALTYGVTAQAGTITARAFLAYVDAEGNTQVVYAAPQTYTYSK